MNPTEIIQTFKDNQAFLQGHFQLSSGLHSEGYMQCARVLQNTDLAAQLGSQLAELIKNLDIDYIVGPAMGGLIIGHEVARALKRPFVFTERVDSQMTLRRGFDVPAGANVFVVEDVVTTGKSVKEVITLLQDHDVNVLGVGAIVDRSSAPVDLGVPLTTLTGLDIKTHDPVDCPLCAEGCALEKPGSRFLM